jgi:hypothetical protein
MSNRDAHAAPSGRQLPSEPATVDAVVPGTPAGARGSGATSRSARAPGRATSRARSANSVFAWRTGTSASYATSDGEGSATGRCTASARPPALPRRRAADEGRAHRDGPADPDASCANHERWRREPRLTRHQPDDRRGSPGRVLGPRERRGPGAHRRGRRLGIAARRAAR